MLCLLKRFVVVLVLKNENNRIVSLLFLFLHFQLREKLMKEQRTIFEEELDRDIKVCKKNFNALNTAFLFHIRTWELPRLMPMC